jgi:Tol biopolymer transport system component
VIQPCPWKQQATRKDEIMSRFRLLSSMVVMAVMATLVLAPTAHATFPDRNGLIAFTADTGSGAQIYTVRPNGHDLRQITHVDGEAIKPDWSPDGRRIAFALNECSIAIMNADGSDLTVLPSQTPGGCEADPSFTPDGSRLVFERYDPAIEDDAVWSMNLDGTDRRRITAPNVGAPDPNVSPDGGTVSFLGGNAKGINALFTASVDGSNLFRVTPYLGGVAFKHDWAPDGRHIVITTNADYPGGRSPNVATVAADGSDLLMLTTIDRAESGAFVGSYSPNGRWIVFRVENLATERFRLFKMRPDGSHRTLIADLPFAPRHIDWGPVP